MSWENHQNLMIKKHAFDWFFYFKFLDLCKKRHLFVQAAALVREPTDLSLPEEDVGSTQQRSCLRCWKKRFFIEKTGYCDDMWWWDCDYEYDFDWFW